MSTRERWIDECNRLRMLREQIKRGDIKVSDVAHDDLIRIADLQEEQEYHMRHG